MQPNHFFDNLKFAYLGSSHEVIRARMLVWKQELLRKGYVNMSDAACETLLTYVLCSEIPCHFCSQSRTDLIDRPENQPQTTVN